MIFSFERHNFSFIIINFWILIIHIPYFIWLDIMFFKTFLRIKNQAKKEPLWLFMQRWNVSLPVMYKIYFTGTRTQ